MSHNLQPRPLSGSQPIPAPANGKGQPSRPVALNSRPVPVQPGTQPVLPTARSRAAEGEDDEPLAMGDVVKNAPPWLLSGVVHMLVLIILGLFYMVAAPTEQPHLEVVPNPWADEFGDPLGTDQFDYKSLTDTKNKVLSISDLPPVDDPFSAPGKVDVALNATGMGAFASSDVIAPSIGNGLRGREIGSRDANLTKFGGTKVTEKGVQMALAWLKKQQQPDGSWSLSGPFTGGVRPEERAAATAMALLAFQGTGNTHKRGKYMEQVLKGKDFLVSRQTEKGTWIADTGIHRMYIHGQCTIALCELYGMTEDPSLKEPAEKAVKFCVSTQGKLGGWRYIPGDDDADISVTGWILMALQSAKMAKIDVPPRTFDNITRFLDSCSVDGIMYGYLSKDDSPTQAMTAEALLCREWLGWPRTEKRLKSGIDYLVTAPNMPHWERWDDLTSRGRDVYFWYYATQAIHHYGGAPWEKWNAVIREILPKAQVKEGPEAGSWDPAGDKWGQFGGRLYVTCLTTYILEVYYRHLPLYDMK